MIKTMKKCRLIKSFCGACLIASAGFYAASAQAVHNLDTSDFLSGIGETFTGKVKIREIKKKYGTKLVVKDRGNSDYFNLSLDDRYQIKKAKTKLKAKIDTDGNLIKGTVKYFGKIKTDEGRYKGRLMKASLGDNFKYTEELLSFDIKNIICDSSIASLMSGGCAAEGMTEIFIKSQSNGKRGIIVSEVGDAAVVPVPAAAWLFGSGLIGLVGMARRRKI